MARDHSVTWVVLPTTVEGSHSVVLSDRKGGLLPHSQTCCKSCIQAGAIPNLSCYLNERGDLESSESTSYRLVPPQGGKNLVIPQDHWDAFMECLTRDDTRNIFENAEKGAKDVYTRLVALGIESKTGSKSTS